jgi:hypothetical protein
VDCRDVRILIIVEGQSDKGFLEAVLKRLNVEFKILQQRGNRPEKAARMIKAESERSYFDKIIVVKDLHKLEIDLIDEHLNEIKRLLPQDLRSRTKTLIVRRSIESWILCGFRELKKELDRNPEELDDPEAVLKELLQRKGRQYFKSWGKAFHMGKEVDIEEIRANCRTFDQFLSLMRDPQ